MEIHPTAVPTGHVLDSDQCACSAHVILRADGHDVAASGRFQAIQRYWGCCSHHFAKPSTTYYCFLTLEALNTLGPLHVRLLLDRYARNIDLYPAMTLNHRRKRVKSLNAHQDSQTTFVVEHSQAVAELLRSSSQRPNQGGRRLQLQSSSQRPTRGTRELRMFPVIVFLAVFRLSFILVLVTKFDGGHLPQVNVDTSNLGHWM